MIRPITLVCFLLACASGLYLYQEKHRVQLIDREIEKTVHATEAIREQTRVLHAEWTLLNDPQRLQSLADQFLSLKTVSPGQFTSLAELDNRLPPVRPPEQEPAPSVAAPVETPVAQQTSSPAPPITETPPPALEKPAAPVVATVAPPRPVEHKPAPAPATKPQVAMAAPAASAPRVEPKPAERHPADVARPRVQPVVSPQTAAPTVGSALGMAHGSFVPPPQPMPVNASQWVAPVGGGGG